MSTCSSPLALRMLIIPLMSANSRGPSTGSNSRRVPGMLGCVSVSPSLAFVPSKADASLFTFSHGAIQIYMLVYVDDIVIAGSTPNVVDRLVQSLSASFPIKDWAGWSTFLDWKRPFIQGA